MKHLLCLVSIKLLIEPRVLTTQTHVADYSIFSDHYYIVREEYIFSHLGYRRNGVSKFAILNNEHHDLRISPPTGSHPTPTITTRRPILKELATLLWVRASGLPWRVWRLKGEESVQRPCLPGLLTNQPPFSMVQESKYKACSRSGGGHHQPLKKQTEKSLNGTWEFFIMKQQTEIM